MARWQARERRAVQVFPTRRDASAVGKAKNRQSLDREVALSEHVNVLELPPGDLFLDAFLERRQKILERRRESFLVSLDESSADRKSRIVFAVQIARETIEQGLELGFGNGFAAQTLKELRIAVVVLVLVGRTKILRAEPIDLADKLHVAGCNGIEEWFVAT